MEDASRTRAQGGGRCSCRVVAVGELDDDGQAAELTQKSEAVTPSEVFKDTGTGFPFAICRSRGIQGRAITQFRLAAPEVVEGIAGNVGAVAGAGDD